MLSRQSEIVAILLKAGADVNVEHKFADGATLKTPFVEYFRSQATVRSHFFEFSSSVDDNLLFVNQRIYVPYIECFQIDPSVAMLMLNFGGKVIAKR